jgi:hypothetical protein
LRRENQFAPNSACLFIETRKVITPENVSCVRVPVGAVSVAWKLNTRAKRAKIKVVLARRLQKQRPQPPVAPTGKQKTFIKKFVLNFHHKNVNYGSP